MQLRITNARLGDERVDIEISEGLISSISPAGTAPEKTSAPERSGAPGSSGAPEKAGAPEGGTIDAGGKYAVPSLKNGHTHAAMTLLRGFAEDMKLGPWLEEKIWPAEAKLEPEDIYWGNRLAALEMIKSGSTFCNDMYLHFPRGWQAFEDAGIKAAIGPALFDFSDPETARKVKRENEELFRNYGAGTERLYYLPSPHSIYTVSEDTLRWVAEFSAEHGLPVHIHLSETKEEVENCKEAHGGLRPAEYLDRVGLLSPRLIAAHAVWLEQNEIELLAERGVTVVHNPVSNMKLASGSCFPYPQLKEAGVPMMLGTDGCSSNNSLDLFEDMKIAGLLQKHHRGDTRVMPAEEILAMATGAASSLFTGLSGELREGAHADLLLIDPEQPAMTPTYDLTANLVYAATGAVVDTTICAGRVLMEGRRVPGEEEVIAQARGRAARLLEKSGD